MIDNAFYRPQAQIARDLGVLAAKSYHAEKGNLRVLDAMTGCGIRALRYYLESGANWVCANDSNPDIKPVLERNLQVILRAKSGKISFEAANRIFFKCYFHQDYYDLIDVDCFGSPAPYFQTMLWAVKIGGLLYLTSTDGRTATGHLPENSLRHYGAIARCHPASQEQVLRLLIGSTLQQSAIMGLGLKPIFSLFSGQTYRVMLQVLAKPNLTLENYGFLGYCHHCGEYQIIFWQRIGKTLCQACSSSLILSGPVWLGKLHNSDYLERMQASAEELGWLQRLELLSLMAAENDFPPYYYTLGEIGRRGKMDIPARSHLIQALHKKGYRATATHINPQAIKTDASLATCLKIARSLN